MTYVSTKLLTLEDFLTQYQDSPRYELADGELLDMEPTGPHEAPSAVSWLPKLASLSLPKNSTLPRSL